MLRWPYLFLVMVGGVLGIFVLKESNMVSYLSDDPKACINCHIMNTAYNTWRHSSHSRDTVCNDCHVPHTSPVEKYFFKAKDGMRHATLFTLRLEPKSFRISKAGAKVVQGNCENCHRHLVSKLAENEHISTAGHFASQFSGQGKTFVSANGESHSQLANKVQDQRFCWNCHQAVPHGRNFGIPGAQFISNDAPNVGSWIGKQP